MTMTQERRPSVTKGGATEPAKDHNQNTNGGAASPALDAHAMADEVRAAAALARAYAALAFALLDGIGAAR